MSVKSLDVPDVVACAVLDVKGYKLPFTSVAIVALVVGNVSVVVPDTAGDDNVTEPDVEPLSIRLAII
jgi:hypothetical protein